jgi:hypothetical protein
LPIVIKPSLFGIRNKTWGGFNKNKDICRVKEKK